MLMVINHQLNVVVCNSTFIKLWNIPAQVITQGGDPWIEAFSAPLMEDAGRFIHLIRERLEQVDESTRDILRFNDGRIFESHSHPQKIEGETVGRVWSFRDVTEQTQAQEQGPPKPRPALNPFTK